MTDRAADALPSTGASRAAATVTEEGFLAGVCHQVRTPLHGILGSLELLLDADISEDARQLATAAFEAALDLHRVFESEIDAVVRAV